jgi:hypothetical protein
MRAEDREATAARYRHSLAPEDARRVPRYAALLGALADSDPALELLFAVPVEQRNPMVILAILHYLALSGDATLAPLYRDLGTPHAPAPDEFAAAVVGYLEAHPQRLRAQLHRTTQTNEVGRSAVLRAVLRELRRRGLERTHLLDVGSSAGLNLYLDHYPVSAVPVADPLTLVCESLTDADRPGELPAIGRRVGIDLHPLRLTDPEDARWLRACLWPEDPERLARLERIEALAPSWPPLTLLAGSVMDRLDEALALTDDGPLVVLHTWAAAYFPEPVQVAFAARLRELVAARELFWVSVEWPRAVPGLALPSPLTPEPRPGACQLVVAEAGDAPRDWGWSHAHGRWLALSPPSGPKA